MHVFRLQEEFPALNTMYKALCEQVSVHLISCFQFYTLTTLRYLRFLKLIVLLITFVPWSGMPFSLPLPR